MKVGLIDVDSYNFLNLALMKLSAYHKQQGHDVSMYMPKTLKSNIKTLKKAVQDMTSKKNCRMKLIISILIIHCIT